MILASYNSLIPKSFKSNDFDVFIYVITPGNSESETGNEDAWRGKLYYLQNLLKARFTTNGNNLTKNVSELALRIQ